MVAEHSASAVPRNAGWGARAGAPPPAAVGLLPVDDGGVAGVEPQDVEGLLIHVVDALDAAVAGGRLDAGVARREEEDPPGLGPTHLGAGHRRTRRYPTLHVDGEWRDDRSVGRGAAAQHHHTRHNKCQTLRHVTPPSLGVHPSLRVHAIVGPTPPKAAVVDRP